MQESNGPGGAWIRHFAPAPEAKRRLVCFPHAGGAASFWHPLSTALHPEVDVLAVQYPGREARLWEESIGDLVALADGAFEALRPWLDERPAFLGHSMGAVVAFEVARRMERELGYGPGVLIASACNAPALLPGDQQLHLADDDGVLEAIMRLGGTDESVRAEKELRQLVLPAIRGDLRAVETYRAPDGAAVSCPLVALVGDQDPEVTPEQARAWGEHAAGAFEFTVLQGDHFYLAARPAAFADQINEVLAAF